MEVAEEEENDSLEQEKRERAEGRWIQSRRRNGRWPKENVSYRSTLRPRGHGSKRRSLPKS
jgi:hypothetical protein